MKIIIVYLAFLAVGVFSQSDHFIGTYNKFVSRDSRSISTVCTSSTVSKRFCTSSGCQSSEITLCYGIGLGFSFNCSDPLPFCAEKSPGEAECVASGSSCGSTSDFICTGEGIYPDPLDCKKFHYCDSNLSAESDTCPNLYVFDPDSPTTNYCRYTNNFYCTLPKCGNEFKNVVFQYPFYPYNRQYVALCVPNQKPKVFKCPDSYVPNLSSIPLTCDFKCKSPGLFPYAGNSTLYYECIYNGQNQLVKRIKSCFSGQIFVEDRCQQQSTTVQPTTLQESTSEATTERPIQSSQQTTAEATTERETTVEQTQSSQQTTAEATTERETTVEQTQSSQQTTREATTERETTVEQTESTQVTTEGATTEEQTNSELTQSTQQTTIEQTQSEQETTAEQTQSGLETTLG